MKLQHAFEKMNPVFCKVPEGERPFAGFDLGYASKYEHQRNLKGIEKLFGISLENLNENIHGYISAKTVLVPYFELLEQNDGVFDKVTTLIVGRKPEAILVSKLFMRILINSNQECGAAWNSGEFAISVRGTEMTEYLREVYQALQRNDIAIGYRKVSEVNINPHILIWSKINDVEWGIK